MVYEERIAWVQLIVTVVGAIVYVSWTLQEAAGGPLTDVVWWPIMLWTIGGGIVASILLSIVWGLGAGLRDPDGVGKSDQRDRDIARMSARVGQSFLVIAGLGVLVLCAIEADLFWIANTMFVGFLLSAFVGGIASVVAYRRGLA
ncbi:hypothetical protein [Microbacterium sp. SLBN-146]|uniref:hypothetical protein n=1 Tax=Microbacterium sp. SLBN-146 TaxID=2768457 RepID=UPI001150C1CC|nr:hypothetical protein [Microbacterium sp. SLBN-146]TQJ30120.1 hypothetical protein FBY39_0565 [Microbacterium sp. SLBN-146]